MVKHFVIFGFMILEPLSLHQPMKSEVKVLPERKTRIEQKAVQAEDIENIELPLAKRISEEFRRMKMYREIYSSA